MITLSKPNKLFTLLCLIFVSNVLIAELIGVKIFSFEKLLDIPALNYSLLGVENINLEFTTGVLIWPIVFILTDIINEYFGLKGVQFISAISAIIILYVFVVIYIANELPPASWWTFTPIEGNNFNRNIAFQTIFGQSQWIIIGSTIAFLFGQLLDALIFKKLKTILKGKNIWLRATLSTLISQLFDSFIVLFIAFYIGDNWSFNLVMAICIVNYLFKSVSALILSPLIYVCQFLIDNYLGGKLASQLKNNEA